jgi:Alpha/beta hydrolase domain
VHQELRALPVPAGAGTACATARELRFWDGEPVPALAEGYVESEYLLSGSARTFEGLVAGPVAVTSEGNRYVTRMLVRSPRRSLDFSGRVVVEPFNTSFGVDRDALWARVGDLIQAQGDAWIGVTTRAMGAAELRKLDAARYAEVDFSVNELAWDTLRDLGALLKRGGLHSPLGQWDVRRVYLGGYSQSAVDIATFAMAFHATARLPDGSAVYDGYFPAAHAASCAAITSGDAWRPSMEHVPIRGIDVPTIEVQPQSDVEGFAAHIGSVDFVNPGSASIRRGDSDFVRDRYRLYEIAGAPHVARLEGCEGTGSSFPTSAFVRAALRLLFSWVEDAIPAPRAPRILVHMDGPICMALVDEHGNPRGGVRSPHLDVPLARYAAHSSPGPMCQLAGVETFLPTESLIARYGDENQYLSEFASALDAAIDVGFLLPADREAIVSAAAAKAHQAFAAADYEEVSIP